MVTKVNIDIMSFIGYNNIMKKIEIFEINGKKPFDDWVESLKDKNTIANYLYIDIIIFT